MKSCFRRGSAAAGLALAAAFTASPALGGDSMVVGTPAPPTNFGPAARANLNASTNVATNLVQRFVLPESYAISSLEFYGTATNIDLYITDLVGAGASDVSNVMWESHGFTSTSGRAWREVDTTGLTLGPGTYYLVMASATQAGGIWTKVDNVGIENVEALGLGTYNGPTQRSANLEYTFDTAEQAFAFRLNGAPIPTPGALAVAGVGGMVGMGRRRR